MTATNRPGALNVLTQAADAAERAAEDADWGRGAGVGWYVPGRLPAVTSYIRPVEDRLITASGPDHWRTIAATLRTAVEWNRLVAAVELRTPEDYATTSTAIAALLPLAEQVLRDLPGTAS